MFCFATSLLSDQLTTFGPYKRQVSQNPCLCQKREPLAVVLVYFVIGFDAVSRVSFIGCV